MLLHGKLSSSSHITSINQPVPLLTTCLSPLLPLSLCNLWQGQPFDTVKVRMQTRPDEFSGVISSTMKIINHEGISALWKGAVPTAGGMVLENCMAFGINEGLKRAFPDDPTTNDNNSPPNILKPFLMGAITGCCSATVLLPSEIIKAKTQVEIKATSSQEILKRMIQRQGFKSLFVGRLPIVINGIGGYNYCNCRPLIQCQYIYTRLGSRF